MVNLYTKLEVSTCIHYEAMNGGAKYIKLGGLGHSRSWAMSPFDRAHMTSYSTSIGTMWLSCIVWDIASYMSKVADFNIPHLHLVTGGDPGRISLILWHQKTRFPGLPCGWLVGVEFNAPLDKNIGHFWGGLHSQSLDWYWQTKQYRKIQINKLDTNQKK